MSLWQKGFSFHPLKLHLYLQHVTAASDLFIRYCQNKFYKAYSARMIKYWLSVSVSLTLSVCVDPWRRAWSWLAVLTLCHNQQWTHPPFLTAPPGFCHCTTEHYDVAKNSSQLSARCDECFTERVKFELNESVGPVSAWLCAATAMHAQQWVSVTEE